MHQRTGVKHCGGGTSPVAQRRWLLAAAVLALGVGGAAACGQGGGGESGDRTAFCVRLDRLATNDPFLAFGDTATPEEIAIAFEALRLRADELVEVAPDDLRPAARDYRDAVVALDEVLAEASYRPDVDAREYTTHQLDYVEAAQRLERHLNGECSS